MAVSNVSKGAIHRRLKRGGGSKWIQGAIKHPGAFSAAAHRAGQSTQSYANTVLKHGSHASAKLKRRAQLARTLSKMAKNK